jgi:hypothetical protein
MVDGAYMVTICGVYMMSVVVAIWDLGRKRHVLSQTLVYLVERALRSRELLHSGLHSCVIPYGSDKGM